MILTQSSARRIVKLLFALVVIIVPAKLIVTHTATEQDEMEKYYRQTRAIQQKAEVSERTEAKEFYPADEIDPYKYQDPGPAVTMFFCSILMAICALFLISTKWFSINHNKLSNDEETFSPSDYVSGPVMQQQHGRAWFGQSQQSGHERRSGIAAASATIHTGQRCNIISNRHQCGEGALFNLNRHDEQMIIDLMREGSFCPSLLIKIVEGIHC
jgi:hypothetical protein